MSPPLSPHHFFRLSLTSPFLTFASYSTTPSLHIISYPARTYVHTTASFSGDVGMEYSIDPGAYPPISLTKSSNYDQKLRANSKSELPQRRRDTDESKDDSQVKLSSLSTDLTSCRGIGTYCPLPSCPCACRIDLQSTDMKSVTFTTAVLCFVYLTIKSMSDS